MSLKYNFANTICELDSGLQKNMTPCERYGITWGCDEDCPVLIKGECELKDTENKELYQRALEEL